MSDYIYKQLSSHLSVFSICFLFDFDNLRQSHSLADIVNKANSDDNVCNVCNVCIICSGPLVDRVYLDSNCVSILWKSEMSEIVELL